MISSAVIVPQPEDLPPPSPSHRRRQSSASYNGPIKRPRLDPETSQGSSDLVLPLSAKSPPRRQPSMKGSGAAEERRRGQRLFGALLGTLSQSSTSKAQKRRADIEKRQLGKLQQRDEELEGEKMRKLDKLNLLRTKEQNVWDEQSMRLRHTNKLAEAHFLKTKAEPRLFYKPWELRADEEEQIRRQIRDEEKSINAELDEHRAKKRMGQEKNESTEVPHPDSSANQVRGTEVSQHPGNQKDIIHGIGQAKEELVSPATTGDDQVAIDRTVPQRNIANNKVEPQAGTTNRQEEIGKQEEKTNEDQGGEELVEGQEDDVIY